MLQWGEGEWTVGDDEVGSVSSGYSDLPELVPISSSPSSPAPDGEGLVLHQGGEDAQQGNGGLGGSGVAVVWPGVPLDHQQLMDWADVHGIDEVGVTNVEEPLAQAAVDTQGGMDVLDVLAAAVVVQLAALGGEGELSELRDFATVMGGEGSDRHDTPNMWGAHAEPAAAQSDAHSVPAPSTEATRLEAQQAVAAEIFSHLAGEDGLLEEQEGVEGVIDQGAEGGQPGHVGEEEMEVAEEAGSEVGEGSTVGSTAATAGAPLQDATRFPPDAFITDHGLAYIDAQTVDWKARYALWCYGQGAHPVPNLRNRNGTRLLHYGGNWGMAARLDAFIRRETTPNRVGPRSAAVSIAQTTMVRAVRVNGWAALASALMTVLVARDSPQVPTSMEVQGATACRGGEGSPCTHSLRDGPANTPAVH